MMADLTAEASLSLGDSYQVDENYTEAVDCYAAALSVVRESEKAVHIRALSHRSAAFYQLERYAEALEDATKALELLSTSTSGLRPGEGEICHKRAGLSAFKLGKYGDAKDALQQAAQLASLNNRPDGAYKKVIQQCDKKLNPSSAPAASKAATASTTGKETNPAQVAKMEAPSQERESPSTVPEAKKAKNDAVFKTIGTLEPNNSVVKTTGSGGAKKPTMPKYQYYQTDKFMTISIVEAGITEKDVHVNFGTKQLTVILRKQGVDFTVIANTLYTEIVVEKSKVVFKDEKVLIKLKKESENYEWHELFGKNEEFKSPLPPKSKSTDPSAPKNRPYSSDRDWDQVEKTLTEDEKKEKPAAGENAMNQFFQQIYADASEETKRAMVKSYQTSGGTVLSCNWDEVKEKDYEKERVAPKGMEWKNWEGKKLPMKEDD
jgi:tetratricopeptide (TPR) repeat protein